MPTEEIKKILTRYLNNSATASDVDELAIWVKNPANDLIFKEFIKTHFAITMTMNKPDPNEIKKQLLREIRKDKSIFYKRRFNKFFRYAAAGIVLVGLGYFLHQESVDAPNKEILVKNVNEITLELENGKTIVVQEDQVSQITNSKGKVIGQQQGKLLVYGNTNEGIETLSYNTLKVPYGKRFDIELSDGTKVYLNSGSSIKYPIKFLQGKSRQVFLKGEAFFDVAHDKEHSFVVDAQELNVQVYGTKFNVSNYSEDEATEVVLTDGSVSLSYNSDDSVNDEVFLKPGFKGALDRAEKSLSTQKVNTTLYTSWLDGNIVFRNDTFSTIIKKLERQYNVIIINNNDKISEETFNATIETDRETIEEVFDYFDEVYGIDYKVINNKIIIN